MAPITSQPTYTLYSDASLSGWGAVLHDNIRSTTVATGGRWTPSEARRHINELEVMAVVQAFRAFDLRGADVHVLVDNTSALAGIKRGYSAAYAINNRLGELAELTSELRILSVDYVASEDNWADAPSRGHALQLSSPLRGRGVYARNVRAGRIGR
jgi:ribonuclease HI